MGERQTAVVLVVDRLGAGFLGPFGNTWIDTPCLNVLASRSLVVEQAWIDSAGLARLYQSLWQGGHAAWPEWGPSAPFSDQLRRRGGKSWLITDEPRVAGHPLHASFDQVEVIETDDRPQPKPSVEETNMARVMSLAADVVVRERPDLVWIHARGMESSWDAPLELRDRFVDEGDPPPPRHSNVPDQAIDAVSDQDELQGWIWAYAGQVLLLDIVLESLLEALATIDPAPLFLMMGARGFPLGEHGRLGGSGDRLYGELTHVPMFVQFPGEVNSVRTQELVQPRHVFHTLKDWLGLADSPSESLRCLKSSATGPWYPLAVTSGVDEWSLRTMAWSARLSLPPGVEAESVSAGDIDCELFLKPDDYWETNDVSDRCPGVVAAFRDLLVKLRATDEPASPGRLLPLDEWLLTRMA